MVAGAAFALSLSGNVMASTVTSADANGTVYLNVMDTSNNTSFMFDTGLSVASFSNSPSFSYSSNLTTNAASAANYAAFVAGQAAGDTIVYDLVGASLSSSGAESVLNTVAAGHTIASNLVSGSHVNQIYTDQSLFLFQAGNPAGGSSYFGPGSVSAQNFNAGPQQTISAQLGGSGSDIIDAALGTALNFYGESCASTATTCNQARGGSTVAALPNTWTFDGTNLTYGSEVSAVPEASTWAMMMLGFAGLGVLSYRRSRRSGGVRFRFA